MFDSPDVIVAPRFCLAAEILNRVCTVFVLSAS